MTTPKITPVACCLALACLALLLCLSSCASSAPERIKTLDEQAQENEEKAQQHRVYYSGWLHPS